MAENYIIKPYLSEQEVQSCVRKLAEQIADDYKSILRPGEDLLLVCVLKGAAPFAVDLARQLAKLGVPLVTDFVAYASYGSGTSSSGDVRELLTLQVPVKDRHILVVEDIIDSGRTMQKFINRLRSMYCSSISLCALFNKACRREVQIRINYCGREIPDDFIVGYGLDYDQKHRFLEDGGVGVVEFIKQPTTESQGAQN